MKQIMLPVGGHKKLASLIGVSMPIQFGLNSNGRPKVDNL